MPKYSGLNIIRIIAVLLIFSSIPISIFLLSSRTTFLNRAFFQVFGKNADITVNLTDSFSMNNVVWANLAQGGEESGGMLGDVVDQVKRLSPDYIRVDHVYDFYNVVQTDGKGGITYDWNKLDTEIGNIIKTGAKPYLSLSYMPTEFSGANELDNPRNWNDWQQLVKATVEHVSGAGGLAIPNVYYEVWNEPDLFGKFGLSGGKNYLTLYYYSSRGAASATNTLPYKIGGPATTALYKNWFNSLLTYSRDNNLRLDFFSWHQYSLNLDDYISELQNAKSWLFNYPKYHNLEFVISESGFDSNVNDGYDGQFGAIHTIALNTALFGNITKNFTFEIKDGPGPEKFWGRWGLLTNGKFGTPEEKPRYEALIFLNKMRGRWHTVLGQGTWVKAIATSDGKVERLLLVNYDAYGKHSENVPVKFLNLPSSRFTLRRIDFTGQITENQVNLDASDSWSTQFLMKPNNASIIEIVP